MGVFAARREKVTFSFQMAGFFGAGVPHRNFPSARSEYPPVNAPFPLNGPGLVS
jgi:hypothetical protein